VHNFVALSRASEQTIWLTEVDDDYQVPKPRTTSETPGVQFVHEDVMLRALGDWEDAQPEPDRYRELVIAHQNFEEEAAALQERAEASASKWVPRDSDELPVYGADEEVIYSRPDWYHRDRDDRDSGEGGSMYDFTNHWLQW